MRNPQGPVVAAALKVPVLRTDRMVLRGWREEDLDEFARLQADPRIAEMLGTTPQDRDDAWRTMAMFIGHWALRGYGQWVAEEAATGALLGRVGLWCPEGWPGIEVGWMIDADRWNEGFATEGGRAAVNWAFTTLSLPEVISVTSPSNVVSRRVMEKVGLTDTGQRLVLRGKPTVLYRLTRPDWVGGA